MARAWWKPNYLSTIVRASVKRAANTSPMKYSANRPTACSKELKSRREQCNLRQSFSAVMFSLWPVTQYLSILQSKHWGTMGTYRSKTQLHIFSETTSYFRKTNTWNSQYQAEQQCRRVCRQEAGSDLSSWSYRHWPLPVPCRHKGKLVSHQPCMAHIQSTAVFSAKSSCLEFAIPIKFSLECTIQHFHYSYK